MHATEIKSLFQRIQTMLLSIRPTDRTTYLYENHRDGTTVVWRFENASSPNEVMSQVEDTAVRLWSVKDYLKECLATAGENPNDVEAFVNQSVYLPVLADIANGTKHGVLKQSRSGKFAKLDGCEMSILSGSMAGTASGDAHVYFRVSDPDKVQYSIAVLDQADNRIGDAFDVLNGAFTEWKTFIGARPALKLSL